MSHQHPVHFIIIFIPTKTSDDFCCMDVMSLSERIWTAGRVHLFGHVAREGAKEQVLQSLKFKPKLDTYERYTLGSVA
jgi:hypothetical protein